MKNFPKGFILNLIACVLSLVAFVVYFMVMYKKAFVFVVLGLAIAMTVAAFLQHMKNKHSVITEIVANFNSVCQAVAMVGAVSVMVNQIAYVVTALDTVDTIMTLIIFETIVAVALILNLIASFMAVEKN